MINNETNLTQVTSPTFGFSGDYKVTDGPALAANGNSVITYTTTDAVVTAEADDDDDDDDDTSTSVTDDDDDEVGHVSAKEDAWTPPTREDYEKLLAAKSKADSEAAARKRFLRDANLDPKTGKAIVKPTLDLGLDDDDDDDVTDTSTPAKDGQKSGFDRLKFEKQAQRTLEREVAKAERTARSSSYSLIAEVPAVLEEAGWNGKNLKRMIKFLDLDEVEIDADGDVDYDSLSALVAELKKDLPEFFKRTRMRDAAKEAADSETVGGGKKQAPASIDEQDWRARMKDVIRKQGIA